MGEVRADGEVAAQLSEAAKAELLELCEEQFAQLEKLQEEIIQCEPDSFEDPEDQLVKRLMATDAELKQWLLMKPSLLATNSDILFQAGKDEMLKLSSDLEMVLSCSEAKRDKLRETKELEQKWLKEKEQAALTINAHIEQLRVEMEKCSEHNLFLETKAKIQKVKAYQENLMEHLGDTLAMHAPPPQKKSSANKNKKNVPQELNEDHISLSEILEVLMDKVINTPHDPYVTIDDTFWPPYVEVLLRYGIAVRHQENNFKIRLETFF